MGDDESTENDPAPTVGAGGTAPKVGGSATAGADGPTPKVCAVIMAVLLSVSPSFDKPLSQVAEGLNHPDSSAKRAASRSRPTRREAKAPVAAHDRT